MTKSPVARLRSERGSATAEYAAVSVAGLGFGGLLIKFLTSDTGQAIIKKIFDLALSLIGL